jgi:nitrate reductase delta subunit
VFQAAALALAYPEQELLERLDTIESALADTDVAELFAPVLTHLRGESQVELVETGGSGLDKLDQRLSALQSFHVQEFDLSRRHALHLSYWTDGDTRRRGEVLAEVKQVYRDSGLLVDTGGELPDYLPMVLEFAARDPERGRELLQRFRASLELIRLGLEKDQLPHAGVLAAICQCLPGESPKTRAEVQARYGDIQPVEFVGLESLGRPGALAETPDLVSTSSTSGNRGEESR